MKLVFMGTADFAVPALRVLAPHVCLVVSQPPRPSGRHLHLQNSPVHEAALELGLPVETPLKARDAAFVEKIRSLEADALVVAAYGQILSEAMLQSAKRGGINLHGSLLPKWRGAAPIQRAVLAGDKETGVTLMQMDKGMDTGDEIARVLTPIGADETSSELFYRLAELAADLARDWMPRIASGDYPRTPQDHALATHAPKVEKQEAGLVWDEPAELNYRRYRAFTTSPGAFLETNLGSIRLSKVRIDLNQNAAPGTILAGGEGCLVAFAGGALDLQELQPNGKRRMSGKDFLNGMRLKPGDLLR